MLLDLWFSDLITLTPQRPKSSSKTFRNTLYIGKRIYEQVCKNTSAETRTEIWYRWLGETKSYIIG